MNEQPKRLYRQTEGAMLAGVCGGLAEYFKLDPSIVRLLAVALLVAAGASLWIYIAAAIILPKKSDIYPDA